MSELRYLNYQSSEEAFGFYIYFILHTAHLEKTDYEKATGDGLNEDARRFLQFTYEKLRIWEFLNTTAMHVQLKDSSLIEPDDLINVIKKPTKYISREVLPSLLFLLDRIEKFTHSPLSSYLANKLLLEGNFRFNPFVVQKLTWKLLEELRLYKTPSDKHLAKVIERCDNEDESNESPEGFLDDDTDDLPF